MKSMLKLSCYIAIALVDGASAALDSIMERRNDYVKAVVAMMPEMTVAMADPEVLALANTLEEKFENLKAEALKGQKSYQREFERAEEAGVEKLGEKA
jgi:hypothetical protein